MSKSAAIQAVLDYVKARKEFMDKLCHDRVKDNKSTISHQIKCTGITLPRLCAIIDIENNRLSEGHTYPDKNILWLRIAEEANRRRIKIWTERSDHFNLIVFGERFRVAAHFVENKGWTVHLATVCDGDIGMDKSLEDVIADHNPPDGRAGAKTTGEDEDINCHKPRTPYRMKWVADLIKTTKESKVNTST